MLLATRDNSVAQALGDEYGVILWFEAFADRAYDSNGHLVSRQLPGAVHHDSETIVQQALTISRGRRLPPATAARWSYRPTPCACTATTPVRSRLYSASARR